MPLFDQVDQICLSMELKKESISNADKDWFSFRQGSNLIFSFTQRVISDIESKILGKN
jgi:hypothetical protein